MSTKAIPGALPKPSDATAIWLLLGGNALTVIVAIARDWPLQVLMWPYWIQSVVIGYYNVLRILGLKRFSTKGFRINDQPVDPTPQT